MARLKQKRDFGAHLFIYLVVNGFLIGIWAFTGTGFFWPVFPAVPLGHRAGAQRLGRLLAQVDVGGSDPSGDGADAIARTPLPVGRGPPLVLFSPSTVEHVNPTSAARRFCLQPLRLLAGHYAEAWSRRPLP
jgi:hypothetical protein